VFNVLEFSDLYDNTEYVAYFTAENNMPINPTLVEDVKKYSVTFKTPRDFIIVPEYYKYKVSS